MSILEEKRLASDTLNLRVSLESVSCEGCKVTVFWQGCEISVEMMDSDTICASVFNEDGKELDSILLALENDTDKLAWIERLAVWADRAIASGELLEDVVWGCKARKAANTNATKNPIIIAMHLILDAPITVDKPTIATDQASVASTVSTIAADNLTYADKLDIIARLDGSRELLPGASILAKRKAKKLALDLAVAS